MLNKVQRGVYSLSDVIYYQPSITLSIKNLFGTIRKQFPLVAFCVWSTKWLSELMIHQPGQFYTIVEVEKEAVTSVFYWLKEQRQNVFLDPDDKEIELYISDYKHSILVIPLISESPLQTVNGIQTVTLEKILVDIVANETLFKAQQGQELNNIYQEAFEKYTISRNKLLRYANRRNKVEKVERMIGEMSKKRQ